MDKLNEASADTTQKPATGQVAADGTGKSAAVCY